MIVRVSDSDEPLALVIEITDAGGGVDGDRVPGLFARGARSRTASGAAGQGLGLYIVRRVMELHSSRVELAANTPHGATMRLVIAQAPGQV